MGHAALLDSVAKDRSDAYAKQRRKGDKSKERLEKLYKLEKGRKEARNDQGEPGRKHVHHRSLSPPSRHGNTGVEESRQQPADELPTVVVVQQLEAHPMDPQQQQQQQQQEQPQQGYQDTTDMGSLELVVRP